MYWGSAVVLTPILMITGGKGNFRGAIYGIGAFLVGYLLSLILYYTIGYTLNALEAIYPNSNFLAISWFGVYSLWVISLVVAPTFLTLKDALPQ